MKRRTVLAGLAALPVLAHARPALATSRYATVILAPHQDDETIRLSAYITHMADRGDDLALITVTDGSATSVRRRLGLTGAQTARWRDREQDTAWAWLTDGRGGPATRLGFTDGAADHRVVADAVADRLASMRGRPELYVATWHHDRPGAYVPGPGAGDAHPDHVACVLAARALAGDGVTVRYARHPERSHLTGTQTYGTTDAQFLRVQAAVAAYRTVGQRSVPDQFRAVLAARGRSVITR